MSPDKGPRSEMTEPAIGLRSHGQTIGFTSIMIMGPVLFFMTSLSQIAPFFRMVAEY